MGQARGIRLPDRLQVGNETVHRRASRSFALGLILVLTCGPATSTQPSAPPSPTPVPLPTLDRGQVSRGREVFVQYCASCHGVDAQGAPDWQQPDARGDLPAPPHDDTGHTWRHSDAQLAEIIRGGLRDQFNKTPELTMPPFQADQLSDCCQSGAPCAGNLPTWRHPQKQSMLRYGPSSVAAYNQPVFMLPGSVECASPNTFARGPSSIFCH